MRRLRASFRRWRIRSLEACLADVEFELGMHEVRFLPLMPAEHRMLRRRRRALKTRRDALTNPQVEGETWA